MIKKQVFIILERTFLTIKCQTRGIGDVKDPEEPIDEPVINPIEPPHTGVEVSNVTIQNNVSANSMTIIYYFENKKRFI